jgi:hypothetical protein
MKQRGVSKTRLHVRERVGGKTPGLGSWIQVRTEMYIGFRTG